MKIKNDEIVIELSDILQNKNLIKKIAETAIFDDVLIECFTKILINGEMECDNDNDNDIWKKILNNKKDVFERIRLQLSSLAEISTKKLINDLIDERDKLSSLYEEWRLKSFDWQKKYNDLRFKYNLNEET